MRLLEGVGATYKTIHAQCETTSQHSAGGDWGSGVRALTGNVGATALSAG